MTSPYVLAIAGRNLNLVNTALPQLACRQDRLHAGGEACVRRRVPVFEQHQSLRLKITAPGSLIKFCVTSFGQSSIKVLFIRMSALH